MKFEDILAREFNELIEATDTPLKENILFKRSSYRTYEALINESSKDATINRQGSNAKLLITHVDIPELTNLLKDLGRILGNLNK